MLYAVGGVLLRSTYYEINRIFCTFSPTATRSDVVKDSSLLSALQMFVRSQSSKARSFRRQQPSVELKDSTLEQRRIRNPIVFVPTLGSSGFQVSARVIYLTIRPIITTI